MKHYLLCTLALVALSVAAGADDEKKAPPPAPDTYKSLMADFSKAQRTLATEYRTAKTPEDRQKILAQYNQVPATFAGRFLEFAQANADDPTAFDALVWVIANDADGKHGDKAIPAIVGRFLDDPKMTRVCQQLSRSTSPAAKKLLQAVMESSKNVDAQGHATYALAKAMVGRSGERNEKAEALLARVIEDFAKVNNGTLAKTAERDLFELQHLSIGCEAPEITSEDIDGVEFSLADYRGKIVVLDFWGNW